jgi:GNAT superfamily N-acetyltransferase
MLAADGPLLRMSLAGLKEESRVEQELSPESRRATLERLWARGLPGDPAAIERALEASPGTPRPAFLEGPPGVTLSCALGPRDVEAAVDMLAGEYWNLDVPRDVVGAALLGSAAWVGAREADGRLVACARAIGDDAKVAWVYDVIVRPDRRGRGLGRAVMTLLLDHPRVRRARAVRLDTRDAQGLYERFGFVDRAGAPRPFPSIAMMLRRW